MSQSRSFEILAWDGVDKALAIATDIELPEECYLAIRTSNLVEWWKRECDIHTCYLRFLARQKSWERFIDTSHCGHFEHIINGFELTLANLGLLASHCYRKNFIR